MKVSDMMTLEVSISSLTAISAQIEESFSREMNVTSRGAAITRSACGRTMKRNVISGVSPAAIAASR
jgi:hypothetical protein